MLVLDACFFSRSVPGLVAFILGLVGAGASAQGPAPKSQGAPQGPELAAAAMPHAPGRKFAGVGACVDCHSGGVGGKPVPKAPISSTRDPWILGDEYATWGTYDKHAQAYNVLLRPRSLKMAELLKGPGPSAQMIPPHRDLRCLACHSSLPIDQLPTADETQLSADMTKETNFNLGVSCEGCHGASDNGGPNQDGWLNVHSRRGTREWRCLSADQRRQKYGYYDVHSPVSRTKLCASCHVGDVRAGRVVTHEMVAAGHPPLGSFEVETYLSQMPPHWQDLHRKQPSVRDEFLTATKTTIDPNNLPHSKNLLIGLLVTWSESLRLSADLADGTVAFPRAGRPGAAAAEKTDRAPRFQKPVWPELAQFACYACHHELKSPAWRQERFFGVPGRPMLQEWTQALVKPALASTSKDHERELDTRLDLLRALLNARPFGAPERVSADARRVADWAEAAAKALETASFTRDQASRLLGSLVHVGGTTPLDYDSACQLVWACNVLYQDLKPAPLKSLAAKDRIGWFREDAKGLTKVEQAFQSMRSTLHLDLHDGDTAEIKFEWEEAPSADPRGEPRRALQEIGRIRSGQVSSHVPRHPGKPQWKGGHSQAA